MKPLTENGVDHMVIEIKKPKPRIRFCWACGNKLRGNHFVEAFHKDGLPRVLHIMCYRDEKDKFTGIKERS